MNDTDRDRPRLTPEEDALVRGIAESWRTPPQAPAQRVAFQRKLEQRIAGRAARRLAGWRVAAVAAAVLAALLVWGATQRTAVEVVAPSVAQRPDAGTPDALIEVALADDLDATDGDAEAETAADAGLPDDYVAIASLWIDR